jgi:hypothetical protein
MRKKIVGVREMVCCIFLAASVFRVYPEQGIPIYVANQNPFIQIFGLPRAEPGTIISKGRLEGGFLYYVSNNAIDGTGANGEFIIWDGETAQYTFRFRYGLSDKIEIGLDVPFIDHSRGYLDSIIRRTHDLWRMPNDRQNAFNKNDLHYKYDAYGKTLYETQNRKTGLGDIRLSAGIPVLQRALRPNRYLAVRALLKLPTGDPDELLGSGGADASLGLALSDYQTLSAIHTALYAYTGVIYLGEADLFRDRQRNAAGYGGISLDWPAMDWLELKLQLDMHSPFYHSELKQLGSSLQLLAGGTLHLPGEVLLDLGMSQQLVTDATPDVGFYLFLRHLF